MMKNTSVDKLPRLTITLGEGQREALTAMADRNHTTLAFIVRYALERFIEEQRQKQLRLEL
jgi:predicted DNA-binding protein